MPSDLHEVRARLIADLAAMTGHTVLVDRALPDGARPDVFAFDPVGSSVLLGDAKAHERPSDRASRLRLATYARWAAAGVASGSAATLMIASRTSDAFRWAAVLRRTWADVPTVQLVRHFDGQTSVVASTARPCGAPRLPDPSGYRPCRAARTVAPHRSAKLHTDREADGVLAVGQGSAVKPSVER